MLHGVVMDILNMVSKIHLITQLVFPIAMLPHRLLALAGSGRRRADHKRADLLPGSPEPQVRVSSPSDRGVGSPRRRGDLSQDAASLDPGREAASAIPGHDCGIRAGANHRADTAGKTTPGKSRPNQRTLRCTIRISLQEEDRVV